MKINIANFDGMFGFDYKGLILSFKGSLGAKKRYCPYDEALTTWYDRECSMENFGKLITGQNLRSDKIKNCLYVANIVNDDSMLIEAANFFCGVFEFYKKNEKVKKHFPYESYHNWPTTGQGNLQNSNYATMIFYSGMNLLFKPIDKYDDVYSGMRAVHGTMQKIATQKSLDDNERGIILRCMLMLRDITKVEKKSGRFNDPENQVYKKFIVGKTKESNYGVEYSRSRLTRIKYVRESFLGDQDFDNLYKKIGNEESSSFDYVQGMSGSTIDYCNWLYFMTKDIEKTVRLFQVNYAAWHLIAPDGMAHSQHESISVLLDMYYDCQLKDAITLQFKSRGDIIQMKEGSKKIISSSKSSWTVSKEKYNYTDQE